jgi:hypothetical protein
MTGNPSGKVRGKRIFAVADDVRAARPGRPKPCGFPRIFMQMGPEAGLFLKKAF